MQQYNNTTIQQYNNTTIQQYNNTTIQQYNNTTIQQYLCIAKTLTLTVKCSHRVLTVVNTHHHHFLLFMWTHNIKIHLVNSKCPFPFYVFFKILTAHTIPELCSSFSQHFLNSSAVTETDENTYWSVMLFCKRLLPPNPIATVCLVC